MGRIDASGALADFEMELRGGNVARAADARDRLAARDHLPAPNQKVLIVGVGGDPAAGVLDQDQVAEAAQFVAEVGDDPDGEDPRVPTKRMPLSL